MNRSSSRKSDTRRKAEQMRADQAATDKKVRIIIITVVSLITVGVLATLAYILMRAPGDGTAGIPPEYSEGQPIVISAEGVGGLAPKAQDVDFYYSYTCGGCVSLDLQIGDMLTEGAFEGEYNLMMRPVLTSPMPYTYAATAAALTLSAHDPDNFLAVHRAVEEFFFEAASNDDMSVLQDDAASLDTVKEIAIAVGVSPELADTFDPDGAAAYLQKATDIWTSSDVEGRERHATPELLVGGKVFNFEGDTIEEAYESLLAAVAAERS